MDNYSNLLQKNKETTRRAVLSECQPFLKYMGEELNRLLQQEPWEENTGSLIAPPVIEHKKEWMTHDETMRCLAMRGFLREQTINALNSAEKERFPQDRFPYKHQFNIWNALKSKDVRAAVITSGTGSGKTEGFLVPILDDLVEQSEKATKQIEGVQALFLYPLNALISSQKKRLDEWTAPFGGSIRYCLYNSLLKKEVASETKKRMGSHCVPDRKELRKSPSPLLITNASMLEHMLIRPEDQSIIEKSKGKLKWIVLDEAHTYVGSQAAEMALLLRRVLIAFGVTINDVKFIATSATLEDSPQKKEGLREFIAKLSGCDKANVHIETGTAVPPKLSTSYRYASQPFVRNAMREPTLVDSCESLKISDTLSDALDNENDMKTRLHIFQRELNGIWACLNPKCNGLPKTELSPEIWPYGCIFTKQKQSCPYCESKVLEVIACKSCGSPHLIAEGNKRRLYQSRTVASFVSENDVNLRAPQEENSEEVSRKYSNHVIIGLSDTPPTGAQSFFISPKNSTWDDFDKGKEDYEALVQEINEHDLTQNVYCVSCHESISAQDKLSDKLIKDLFAKAYVGKQYLSNAITPELLKFNENNPEAMPTEQRLITFTDSRQGVAKSAAQLDQEMSRVFLRGFIFHQCRQGSNHGFSDEQIEIMRAHPNQFEEAIAKVENAGILSWEEAKIALKKTPSLERLQEAYSQRDPQFSDNDKLAQFLLIREFARFSASGRTLENMGLIAVTYTSLTKSLLREHKPSLFAEVEDWFQFLHIFLNHYLRGKPAIDVNENILYHAFKRRKPVSLLAPGSKIRKTPNDLPWPSAKEETPKDNLTKLLCAYGELSPKNSKNHRNKIDEVYQKTFETLKNAGIIKEIPERGYQIDPLKVSFKIPNKVYLCPHNQALRAYVLRGYVYNENPKKVEDNFAGWRSMFDKPDELIKPNIEKLRAKGIWSSSHDRVIDKWPYLRSVEHSAQVPRQSLETYERDFNQEPPNIQVLNCSTTMEMGVDLAGVQTVFMHNVPPRTTNYLQRIGRAGRRAESKSIAYTMCSNRPHDLGVYSQPLWPFITPTNTHPLHFKNKTMIQKHINAFLLGQFLLCNNHNAMKMNNVSFFSTLDDTSVSVFSDFYNWIETSIPAEVRAKVLDIIKQTALEPDPVGNILLTAKNHIARIKKGWAEERKALLDIKESLPEGSPATSGLKYQLDIIENESLITELVNRTFLPGHGFPTNVVPFKYKIPKKGQTKDNSYPPGYPTRSMAIALREYAPGNELMLNGLVHKVKGITLNWKIPLGDEDDHHIEVQNLAYSWFCKKCGDNKAHDKIKREKCPKCLNPLDITDEHLTPRGFSVDFLEMPTEAYTSQVYPKINERAHLNFEANPWKGYADPLEFATLIDIEADIITTSIGEKQNGYDLCLCCGRVEESNEKDTLKNHTPLFMVDESHNKKAFRNNLGKCKGNDSEFRIKYGIALGGSEKHPAIALQHPKLLSRDAAVTLGVILSQRICEVLGVDEDELSFLVDECPQNHIKYADAIYYIILFDSTAGGAGHVESSEEIIEQAMQESIKFLSDCDCPKACSKCLISPNHQRYWNQLDRHLIIS